MEVRANSGEIQFVGLTATVWGTYNWAREWYDDAVREAQTSEPINAHRQARRREILFAVCCAEAYILEWVRDEVLTRGFDQLQTYFPADDTRGVRDKWKCIPKELVRDGLLSQEPDFGGPHGEDWRRLLAYRNGLVHARASRPDPMNPGAKEQPKPATRELNKMSAGWAIGVVRERIKRLHAAAATEPPSWLNDGPAQS